MTVWPYDRWMYGYGYMDMDMDMDMDVDMDMDMDIDVYHRPNLELACNVGSRLFDKVFQLFLCWDTEAQIPLFNKKCNFFVTLSVFFSPEM